MNVHEHVPHFAVSKSEHRAPPSFAYKIRELLHRQMRRERSGNPDPRFRVTLSKLGAYAFLDRLNVSHARVRAVVPLNRLHRRHLAQPVVLKPLEGRSAMGVAVLEPHGDGWTDVLRDTSHTFDSLTRWLAYELERLGTVDRWILEERVYPPRDHPRPVVDDIKVYAFRGEIALLLMRRGYLGEVAYRWFSPELQPVDTGKYAAKLDETLVLSDVAPQAMSLASRISMKAPFAFLRVDTLVSSRGVMVGELNSHVGAYDGFNDAWDQRLGIAWERAESTLDVKTGRPIPKRVVDGHYPALWRRR